MPTHPKAAYTEQTVVVAGVPITMIDDTAPDSNFMPMQVALTLMLRMGAEGHADITTPPADSPEFKQMAERLMEAGVDHLPLYRSEADRLGIEWSAA